MVHFPRFAPYTLWIQMNGNECSHSLGFPIRKSPDHSLLAASRSLSQLITSFFAYLRQGIHTHALSSLTIKSTSHTHTVFDSYSIPALSTCALTRLPSLQALRLLVQRYFLRHSRIYRLVFSNARQYSVVKDLDCLSNQYRTDSNLPAVLLTVLAVWLVWWA